MSITSHTLDTKEIQSLVSGDMVELGGRFGIFLGKEFRAPFPHYSFMINGKVESFKGTLGLMHRGLKKVNQ